jgi:prophage regulatory protein
MPETNHPTRIMRKPEVKRSTGLSDTTIWRRVRAGDFPPPFRLSPGTVGWRERDIEAWIEQRATRTKA